MAAAAETEKKDPTLTKKSFLRRTNPGISLPWNDNTQNLDIHVSSCNTMQQNKAKMITKAMPGLTHFG